MSGRKGSAGGMPSKRRHGDDEDEDDGVGGSKTAGAAAAAASTPSGRSKSGSGEIISLLDDGDFATSDTEDAAIDRAVRNSLSDAGTPGGFGGRAAKRARRKPSPKGVDDSFSSAASGGNGGNNSGGGGDGGIISLLSDSDSDDNHGGRGNGSAAAAASSSTSWRVKNESAGARKMDVDDSDDEVVEVLAPSAPVLEPATAAGTRTAATAAGRKTTGEDDDDEIETLGTANVLRLPHARHDCTQHTFVVDVSLGSEL